MGIVLGIESSCDETAAALVDDQRRIVAQRIASQDEEHRPYGGVVPEIAARAHAEKLSPLIAAVLADAGMELGEVDAIAATAGPGLIGGVMVGLVTAKALAMASDKPLIAINHLEGHALSPRLADPGLGFPYLLLLVSGGHCQILRVAGVGRYRRLATTIDDALGEAFDKTAKILGLGYPGGPAVERLAAAGDPAKVRLPRPLLGSAEPHFSFAGLKSAVLRAKQAGEHSDADIAASFQQAAIDCVIDRTRKALLMCRAMPVASLSGDEIGQDLSSENIVGKARKFYREFLQGREIERTGLGTIRFTGKGWQKTKRGLTTDFRRAQLIPAAPQIIELGSYGGRSEVAETRKDGIVAFHHFFARVSLDGAVFETGVSVGEDTRGHLYYNLNRDPFALLGKRKLRQSDRGKALGLPELSGSIAQNNEKINTALVVAGGVAANRAVRAALETLAAEFGLRFVAPPPALCTDNAAMIAWAGIERLSLADFRADPLDIAARPRWPLDPGAEPVRGAGVKA